MNSKETNNVISIPQLWKLFSHFLSVMGPTYVDHCVRTSYLVLMLCKKQHMDPVITRKVVFAAYFHDIGSIGKDVPYLMHPDYDIFHSVDGYLLLKYKSPLKDWAKVILYHHISYNQHIEDEPYTSLGLKIAICDRMDDWERHHIPFDKVKEQIKNQSGKAFDPKDVKDLLEIADDIDIQEDIKSGRYKDILDEYVNSLDFSSEDIQGYIAMLASLFELYDTTTYNHSKTVALIGGMLTNYMGYDEKTCFKVYVSGLIHDLGKIFIPLSIIDKPGKLTPEEYEVMKRHVVYSKELTKDIFSKEIVDIACDHHERIDGSGYPNHLKQEEMNELIEILQVDDVISALIAKRSYKEEFPYEKVIEILDKDVANGKFNKKIVDVFKENHEEILKYANMMINEGYDEAYKMQERREQLISSIKEKRAILKDMPLSNFMERN